MAIETKNQLCIGCFQRAQKLFIPKQHYLVMIKGFVDNKVVQWIVGLAHKIRELFMVVSRSDELSFRLN